MGLLQPHEVNRHFIIRIILYGSNATLNLNGLSEYGRKASHSFFNHEIFWYDALAASVGPALLMSAKRVSDDGWKRVNAVSVIQIF